MYIASMTTVKSVKDVHPDTLNRSAEVIRTLGHAERLKIVEVLEHGEATVSAIQEALGLPQATVSQHQARMRGCGIVQNRRDGVNVYYRINEPKVYNILHCIRRFDQ
jgi:DNA-binding transcriptional ArsR family regulator